MDRAALGEALVIIGLCAIVALGTTFIVYVLGEVTAREPAAIFTDMGEARQWHRDCLRRTGSVQVREYEYGVELTCVGGDDE